MVSPTERITLIEKKLQEYSLKKSPNRTISSISDKIAKRIKILNSVNSELMSISKELYYYNMVDHIGKLKIEVLSEKHCISILSELYRANEKFVFDNDLNYQKLCEKLQKRVMTVCLNLFKNSMTENCLNFQNFQEFFNICTQEYKEKLRKAYFINRKREISIMIRECNENFEKNYQLLIASEVFAYEKTFRIKAEVKDKDTECSFSSYILSIFRPIFYKTDRSLLRSMCLSIPQNDKKTVVDSIFYWLYRNIFISEKIKTVEI